MSNTRRELLILVIVSTSISACTNGGLPRARNGSATSSSSTAQATGSQSASLSSGTMDKPQIVKVAVKAGSGSSSEKVFEISFGAAPVTSSNQALPENLIKQLCQTSAGLYPGTCSCKFVWKEYNNTTPNTAALAEPITEEITRTVYTPVTLTQDYLAACAPPPVYDTEIAERQSIDVTIVPNAGHQKPFTITAREFIKPSTVPDVNTVSFQEMGGSGARFRDVWRYTCHEKIRRGMSIKSRTFSGDFAPPMDEGKTFKETRTVSFASQFCTTSFKGAASNNCTPAPIQLSSQLNYFSLYIPFSEQRFHAENDAFSCPRVTGGINERPNSPFPLDSRFALATTSTKTFNVAVEARSLLGGAPDTSTNTSCRKSKDGSSNTSSSDSKSLTSSCLGFAAQPAADGSCGSIEIPDGLGGHTTKRMYRLRRYNALYPAIYDTNGEWISGNTLKVDQIYVLDRPAQVQSPTTTQVISSTVFGPKPCPFAWYDHSGVTTGVANYQGTSDLRWKGKSADGISLPYIEDQTTNSCPALLPYDSSSNRSHVIKLKSLTADDTDRWIRPIQSAWSPIYLEETDFKACAPESGRVIEPPVHHWASTVNGATVASYCEEVYPTSHRGKSTGHAAGFEPTIQLQSGDEAIGAQYPLLAPADDIVQGLASTFNYGCRASSTTAFGRAFPVSGVCCLGASGTGSTHLSTCTTDPTAR